MRFGKLRGRGLRPPLTEAETLALRDDLAVAAEQFRARHPAPAAGDPFAAAAADPPDLRPDPGFPAIDENAGPWHVAEARAPAPPEPPRAPAPPVRLPFPPQLAAAPVDPAIIRRAIDAAVERLRHYLGAVVNLLNARPCGIGRSFGLAAETAIGGLAWREGFIEYADPRYETPELPGAFTLHYTLFAPGAVTLAVLPAAAPTATEKLMRHDLAFAVREGGGLGVDSREIAYVVERQIRARLEFRPDYAHSCVSLDARNLEALGSRLYAIDPAAVDETALAQIADFIVARRLDLPPALGLPRWS